MTKQLPTEHMEQVTLVAWFARQHPQHRLFSIPNGATLAGAAHTRAKQVERLKAEGMSNGVPDLFLPIPTSSHHGLFIEMKRQKGGVLSKEQKEWLSYLNDMGYLAKRCNGWLEAKEVIECYLNTTT